MANDSYEIGYGKPPKHIQFKKGQSGNPKGRPKKPKNLAALILKTFGDKVIRQRPWRITFDDQTGGCPRATG